MYLSMITIENFRCFGEGPNGFCLSLRPGLTALVGENDAGKTAVVDAIRFVLGTTDQEWYRLEDNDFHKKDATREIRIVCQFAGLNAPDKRAFVEYLTYGEKIGDEPVLYINWTAKDMTSAARRTFRPVEICSGKNGEGPNIAADARALLWATYLRPLRDAEQALSAGRSSRLSQILRQTEQIKTSGVSFDPNIEVDPKTLNVLGIGDLANALLEKQQGIVDTRDRIDRHLRDLSLNGDGIKSGIKVSNSAASADVRLRQLLEKLILSLDSSSDQGDAGKLGLGSNNLLFMACELLLLTQVENAEYEGIKMLLIEEPEAHLHTQRQLRVMKSLQELAKDKGIQIIVTTHSPNLASVIALDNLVMIQNGRAFSLAKGETELELTDYRFLERFLDVTKANLFFARGVMIVEGDAENILIPTLASLIGSDFTENGVSIVKVSGVGLRRYARIFQRKDIQTDGLLDIPVACVTDMDVMPDCGEMITGKTLPTKGALGLEGMKEKRAALCKKTTGQQVKTFISDEWTLEYDLAFSGLAEDVYVAAYLAKKDDALAKKNESFDNKKLSEGIADAQKAFQILDDEVKTTIRSGSNTYNEVLAANVYAQYTKGTKASKAMAAQYLAEILLRKVEKDELKSDELRSKLPNYLVAAIEYVARTLKKQPSNGEGAAIE